MKLTKSQLASALPDVLLVAGAAVASYGAGLVYAPAGFIAAGLLLMAGGYLTARASD